MSKKIVVMIIILIFVLPIGWINLKPRITIKNESPYKVWIYDMQYRDGIEIEEYSYQELASLAKAYTSLKPNQSITLRLNHDYLFEDDDKRLFGVGWSFEASSGKRQVFTETFTVGNEGKCGVEYAIRQDGYEKSEKKWPFICFRQLGESFIKES